MRKAGDKADMIMGFIFFLLGVGAVIFLEDIRFKLLGLWLMINWSLKTIK